LVTEATRNERSSIIVVNNKAEGSAPLSAIALAKQIVGDTQEELALR
jgi:hypothetical protein